MDYDVVRTSVKNAYKYYGQKDSKFYGNMNNFYTEGKNNPSVAKIIMQNYIMNCKKLANQMLTDADKLYRIDVPAIMYPDMAAAQRGVYGLAVSTALKSISADDLYKNTEYLEADRGTYDLGYANDAFDLGSVSRKEFDARWKELYPRTGKIRERSIDANRIVMDKVTQKAGWYEKINYAKTMAEYKKDYPKTFFTRYWLIMNSQIGEGKVTPRVKNWFKRFAYKRLIKDGFCFKK